MIDFHKFTDAADGSSLLLSKKANPFALMANTAGDTVIFFDDQFRNGSWVEVKESPEQVAAILNPIAGPHLFKVEPGGFISFFDRCKDIIIRGGNNISAQEVENLLQAHHKVADVAAVGMPDEVLGERTCVYVVPRDAGQMPNLEELTDFMREQGTAIYKLPERVEQIEAIPRNPVGKILKPQLRKDIADKIALEQQG